jgi:hypothetical protein
MSDGSGSSVIGIRKRAYLLAHRAGVDFRTAAKWITDPNACQPSVREKLEKAATKGEASFVEQIDDLLERMQQLQRDLVELKTQGAK